MSHAALREQHPLPRLGTVGEESQAQLAVSAVSVCVKWQLTRPACHQGLSQGSPQTACKNALVLCNCKVL